MDIKKYLSQLQEAKNYVLSQTEVKAKLGLVLGSGLSDLVDSIDVASSIPYSDIPHFPKSTVEGHKGNLVVGRYKNLDVLLFQGRVHYYEGYAPEEVVFPTRLFKTLGGESLVLTNASGSLNPDWPPGDVMVIDDHINFTGYNPLTGPNLSDFGPRFNDMSKPYNKALSEKLKTACAKANLNCHQGTYLGVSGPSYETPAEIKAFKIIGADAVGMSTVPECIAANHAGIKVAGLSCLTNFASGISEAALSHEEVQETSFKVKEHLIRAMTHFFETY